MSCLPPLYVKRRNSVARNIYYDLCVKYRLAPIHYSNQASTGTKNDAHKIKIETQTRLSMMHRKIDIVVLVKKAVRWTIIEVLVTNTQGLQKQGYQDQETPVNSTELTY
ncbi:hypothetical protein AB6A40_002080 [Gnathostoma spinigerum]|uniref:Uncharacterized protein n=1 Tax=Gnathostoma spinigerum TaxID=75299 RepID=A0ABD6EDC1_9BILA